jgi:hypothetical protein
MAPTLESQLTAEAWAALNYPWHRAALLQTLGTSEDVEAVAGAIEQVPAEDLEALVFAAGGIAAADRSQPGSSPPSEPTSCAWTRLVTRTCRRASSPTRSWAG